MDRTTNGEEREDGRAVQRAASVYVWDPRLHGDKKKKMAIMKKRPHHYMSDDQDQEDGIRSRSSSNQADGHKEEEEEVELPEFMSSGGLQVCM